MFSEEDYAALEAELKALSDAQEKNGYYVEELKKDPIWYDFFYTKNTTGMRVGEICALQWDDFDEKRCTLKVRRSFSMDQDRNLIIGDTKTFTGNRTILLPPSTASVLRERKNND